MGQSNSQQERDASQRKSAQSQPNYRSPQHKFNCDDDFKPSAPPPPPPYAKFPTSSSQSSGPLPHKRAPASSKPPSSPPPYTPSDTNTYAHQPRKTPNPVNPTEMTSPFISKQTVDNGFVIVEKQNNVRKTPTSLYPNINPLMTIDVTVPPPSIAHYSKDASEEDSTVLDCPVCADELTLPVLCCESGHSVCNTCRQYAQQCIICRKPNTTTRNIALESLLKKDGQRRSKPNYHKDGPRTGLDCSVCNNNPNISCGACRKYNKPNTTMQNGAMESSFAKTNRGACPNALAGCTYKINAGGYDNHRQDCYYRLIACPRAGCYWENRLVDILQHFSSSHVVNPQQKIELNKNFTFKVLLNESMADVQIFQYHQYNKQSKPKKHYFIYTFRLVNETGLLLWTLQRYGSNAYASRWLYDLTLVDNTDPKHQIIWTEKCVSDAQHSQTVMNTGRCVAVPLSVAKNFMSHDSRITIRIFVRPKKMQE